MRLIVIILFFLNCLLAQTFNVSVDKNTLEEGDVLQLMIEVLGSKNFPKIDLEKLSKDFDVVGGPFEQTTIEYINGKMKSAKKHTWTLSPNKTGNLTIHSFEVIIDGKKNRSRSINIVVTNNRNSGLNNNIFIVAEVDKDSAYLGEQITLSYKLYKHVDTKISGVDQFQMPEFNGFWVEELFTPQRLQYQNKDVLYEGRKFKVANLGQRALFPIASDQHMIPSVNIKTQIEKKKKTRRRDPFFDPFFSPFFSETETKFVKSDEKTIKIKKFPEPKPINFNGAVGEFEIDIDIDQSQVEINDGITFSLNLNGTGNLGLFTLPNVDFPVGLEAFSPNNEYKKDVFRNQITGSQRSEYVIIPRKSGNFEIPKIRMSYFNLKNDSWSFIETQPINIIVTGENSLDKNLSGLTKKEVELIEQDIRYIKTNSIGNINPKYRLSYGAYFLYPMSIIILLLPTFFLKIIKKDFFKENDHRKKNAIKKSLKILKIKNSDSYSTASEAIYIFLQEKFLLPSHNLDPLSVNALLKGKIEKIALDELIRILKLCDAGKYSPNDEIDRTSIIKKTQDVLQEINKMLK